MPSAIHLSCESSFILIEEARKGFFDWKLYRDQCAGKGYKTPIVFVGTRGRMRFTRYRHIYRLHEGGGGQYKDRMGWIHYFSASSDRRERYRVQGVEMPYGKT